MPQGRKIGPNSNNRGTLAGHPGAAVSSQGPHAATAAGQNLPQERPRTRRARKETVMTSASRSACAQTGTRAASAATRLDARNAQPNANRNIPRSTARVRRATMASGQSVHSASKRRIAENDGGLTPRSRSVAEDVATPASS